MQKAPFHYILPPTPCTRLGTLHLAWHTAHGTWHTALSFAHHTWLGTLHPAWARWSRTGLDDMNVGSALITPSHHTQRTHWTYLVITRYTNEGQRLGNLEGIQAYSSGRESIRGPWGYQVLSETTEPCRLLRCLQLELDFIKTDVDALTFRSHIIEVM